MSDTDPGWTAVISVRMPRAELATWLERTLLPEASREVPRAKAAVARPAPEVVEIRLSARDTGSVRAAMNTYLGWVHLALATLARAHPPPKDGPAPSP
ncbi:MAG: hypothetical protein L3K10_08465 [Thermoplasmata archaeon]|nr:hypothetical protein [Thermoplasmata archaeon]